jgi:xanthine dehydrogenase YagS FAD-binding subunit
MKPFRFDAAVAVDSAVQAGAQPGAMYLGGGTNLVDLMKEGVETPSRLVDVNRLPLAAIETRPQGLRLGATARNTATADHPTVRTRFPLLSQAILAGASGQLRNMATNGGNLRQRTRCPYFYDIHRPCNKRAPGTGCAALGGINRTHAILGASDACVATYPGDMAQALHALDAVVQVQGPRGARTIPIAEFHRLADTEPQRDSTLDAGELITAIDLPADAARFAPRSHYLKVRDRASYAFALVSVAAALDMTGGTIRQARLCLGGVAHMPWRARKAEAVLANAKPNEQAFNEAAEAELATARPLEHNRFKIDMTRRAIVRALQTISGTSA